MTIQRKSSPGTSISGFPDCSLGMPDGFSILYYQDVDSLIYWANQAAYRWKLRGMCMWSLGQEDMRVWEWLPKQTE